MERPLVPGAWRFGVGAAGGLLLTIVVFGDALSVSSPTFFTVLGGALALSMLRGDARDRRVLLAGLGLAALFGFVSRSPAGALLGLGLTIPAALVAARPQPLATSVTALGLGALLLALLGLAQHPAPEVGSALPREVILRATSATLGVGLLLHALVARSAPTPPLPRAWRVAAALGAGLLLALAFFTAPEPPFAPIAIASLAALGLARWRAWPAAALVVGAIALAGSLPAGVCELERPGAPGNAPPLPTPQTLAQVAGQGPRAEAAGYATSCPPRVVVLGAAWGCALVGATLVASWREDRR